MIVCLCRRISSHQISQHLSCGAKTSQDIFNAQGCKPGCGRCLDTMTAMLGNEEPTTLCNTESSPNPSYMTPASSPMMAAE